MKQRNNKEQRIAERGVMIGDGQIATKGPRNKKKSKQL
jgi:hypothetical protein